MEICLLEQEEIKYLEMLKLIQSAQSVHHRKNAVEVGVGVRVSGGGKNGDMLDTR